MAVKLPVAGVRAENGDLVVADIDYAGGHFLTTNGTAAQTSNDLNSHAAWVINLGSSTVWVRGDGQAAVTNDPHGFPLQGGQCWSLPAYHDARTLSVFGPNGVVVQILPIRAVQQD